MSMSREAFLRQLPAAAGGVPFLRREAGDGAVLLEHQDAGRRWRIRLDPLPDRRLGALNLERIRVQLALEGFSLQEEEAWLERFRAHFQRAGG
jgi:hypothetical protein